MAILFKFDVDALFSAPVTRQLFASMSHQYKYSYVETIIRQRSQLLKEIDQAIKTSREN